MTDGGGRGMGPAPARLLAALRVALWIGAPLPAAWLLVGHLRGWLGVNPIEKLTHVTGLTALVLLLVTLAVTPARRITGWNPVIRLRRPLGLFAFFYAALHVAIWLVLDLGLEIAWAWEDIRERPYVTVGMAAFLLLVPLAATSSRRWIRRLGRRWARLHALIYPATALGIVHFWWLVKSDVRLPLTLGAIFGLLMAARLPAFYHAEGRKTPPRRP